MIQWIANPHVHLAFEIIGYIAGAAVFVRIRSRHKDNVPDRARAAVLTGAAIGAAIGMRVLFWLSYPDVSISSLFSGKTVVGGLLGGLAGVEITKRILGVKRSTGDLFVFPLITAMCIGRIGCFLTGPLDRTAGVPSHVPWAIAIGDGVPRQPVALYEIAFLLMIIPLLLWVRRNTGVEGDMFRTFMIAYLAFRLFEDFLKPDPPPLYAGLSAIQFACIGGLAYYFAILIPRFSQRAAEA